MAGAPPVRRKVESPVGLAECRIAKDEVHPPVGLRQVEHRNYFGTVAIFDGLRSCLAISDAPAAVVVSSSSTLNRGSDALVRACLRGDETQALATAGRLIRTRRGSQIYRSSKLALNLWVRSAAVTAEWAGQDIVLNAVAPGIIATEAVTRSWPQERLLLETALPQPLGSPGPVKPV
ncbi:MAG TPA: SDR family oxidoreductase, partial [Micromonosporaceae bacterium]|nr:SDR family oxidoreductase [Micromonosporaceae bacterium]